MRVATYNVLHGRSLVDGRVDVDRFATAVRALDADVVALQEVDRGQSRSRRADLATVAAEAMGGDVRFVATMHGLPGLWRTAHDDLRTSRPAYGVALVSRLPVTSWSTVRLPRRPGIAWVGSGRVRRPVRDEPRAAVTAVVETPDGPITVVGTHLSWLPDWHSRQLTSLLEATEGLPRPFVLMGDLNMTPAQVGAASTLRALATEPTYPVGTPTRQIDHILGDGDVRATGPATSIDTGLSDHRALVVDVVPGRAEG
ncbi:endonuclease/exonuclease/phosphatase family protein [Cellulomonas edaphi]|uniref:Endonuclease/exonuclease/phosphatase family protein n=1 Tax=Cellulomonas edaphi TaxID=3053468 RepID=A0ABT7S650_9CELL|nr:endonuclease/exonuclease/phosphatase family protein [Cellulomons edaphi]MDM7831066.1 endonuclease/exonuclease/phosphatase family protein [Cellulomons edaphi]